MREEGRIPSLLSFPLAAHFVAALYLNGLKSRFSGARVSARRVGWPPAPIPQAAPTQAVGGNSICW